MKKSVCGVNCERQHLQYTIYKCCAETLTGESIDVNDRMLACLVVDDDINAKE